MKLFLLFLNIHEKKITATVKQEVVNVSGLLLRGDLQLLSETWIQLLDRKFWRKTQSYESVSWNWNTTGLNNEMMIHL